VNVRFIKLCFPVDFVKLKSVRQSKNGRLMLPFSDHHGFGFSRV
jgi:hypothetical protein